MRDSNDVQQSVSDDERGDDQQPKVQQDQDAERVQSKAARLRAFLADGPLDGRAFALRESVAVLEAAVERLVARSPKRSVAVGTAGRRLITHVEFGLSSGCARSGESIDRRDLPL